MNSKRHYRQLLLYVFVLILPSLLVVWLGWTNIALDGKNRDNEKKTSDDAAHNSARTEVGKDVWDRLENIKSQEVGTSGTFDDPAVKFVAWVDGERITMPWEKDPSARLFNQTISETGFAARRDDAERAERARPLDPAIVLYRGLIQSAATDGQRAYARLRYAAVLRQSGATEAAASSLRELLSLPSNVVNGDGDSFAFIAAGGLVDTAASEVLARIARELESPAALTLDQTSQLRDVLIRLQDSGDAGLRADAKSALKTMSARIASLKEARVNLEQDADLLALRSDFPKLSGLTERAWQSYGASGAPRNALLISRAPAGAGSRPLVIAVRRDSILEAVRVSRKASLAFHVAEGIDSGEPLDEQRLPGLKVVFPPPGIGTAAPGLQRTFYAGMLLVVSLNLFGGYLLWRDTRRETRLSELRSQFVSSVSHELKTPLTSIRMFAEILQMGSAPDAQTRDECLDTIVNESERLTRLLNNVLDFSRIEHGQKTYQMEPTRLAEVVNAAAKTMQYPLAEQGFALRVNLDEGIPPVDADRDALKQAVLNLLTNAMKYSGQSRDIELRLFPENGDAMIQVQDYGIGIPAGELSRIFERFYRAPVEENRAISGTGLGLALVAHIAEAHGGRVQVESSPGSGSTFSIRLPAHVGAAI